MPKNFVVEKLWNLSHTSAPECHVSSIQRNVESIFRFDEIPKLKNNKRYLGSDVTTVHFHMVVESSSFYTGCQRLRFNHWWMNCASGSSAYLGHDLDSSTIDTHQVNLGFIYYGPKLHYFLVVVLWNVRLKRFYL